MGLDLDLLAIVAFRELLEQCKARFGLACKDREVCCTPSTLGEVRQCHPVERHGSRRWGRHDRR
jgi:hypothetical protein